MIYHMSYGRDLDYARQHGRGKDREWEYMDDTTLSYIRLQSAVVLFDYLRSLDAVYLVPAVREDCDRIFNALGAWLEKECPQAVKDPDKLPDKQRRRYRTTLPLMGVPRA